MEPQAQGQHPATEVSEGQAEFITEFDLHLFTEGTHYRLYDKLGAHIRNENGVQGTYFAVWAPNAQRVYLMGDFNHWDPAAHPLSQCRGSGIWGGFVPGVTPGSAYQFHIASWHHNYEVDKRDPFGFRQEEPPRGASFVWDLQYDWHDQQWLEERSKRQHAESAVSIYEVHLNSWMRVPEEGNRPLTFRELAPKLADYVRRREFTHVHLMPVMEHPAYGSKEHLICGYFAPASRFGAPQDFMHFVDVLHEAGIGVILDWVPTHFHAGDRHGLSYFDGTQLYESSLWPVRVPKNGDTRPFDFSRPEVRAFLISNAFYWLEKYHVDGLKVVSASALLHMDYGRRPGEWVPNVHGGRENLDGIQFVRQLASEVNLAFPDAVLIAEEQSDWPNTTVATHSGGLGFDFKWDSHFTENLTRFLGQNVWHRKVEQSLVGRHEPMKQKEKLILPLAHSTLSNRQGSLLSRMAGDDWQRLANLRLLLGLQYCLPGKKLLFMGIEFGQWQEWNPNTSLDWHLLALAPHQGAQRWVTDLNATYRRERALHQADYSDAGFECVDCHDPEQSTLTWLRRDARRREVLLVICNFTAEVRRNFRVGVRRAGFWRELLNSDASVYWGSGQGNLGGVSTAPFRTLELPHTLTVTLPPLGVVVFKHDP